jgi:hypothetical protein
MARPVYGSFVTERRASWMAYAVVTSLAASFWGPALTSSRGWFPAPLDDVFIHFDFARSLAERGTMEWVEGRGYSSGETAPLYALVLALGWTLGFRAKALGVWAGLVALGSVASLIRSVRRLLAPCPPWLGWGAALLPISFGVANWTLFSGMEVALCVAMLGRALETLAKLVRPRQMQTREHLGWKLGLWGAALVMLRPEAVIVVAIFGVFAARAAGPRSALLALMRATLPGALAVGILLAVNRHETGDARSAGAILKLLSSNPFLSDVDRARAYVEHLVTLWFKVLRVELSATPLLAGLLPALALVALADRGVRARASACMLSALGWTLLASWNGNAPHHNFRYYVPAIVLLGIASAIGIAALSRSRVGSLGAALVGAFVLASTATTIPAQARHFRASTGNIRDHQIAMGELVARLPSGSSVLLGDAGAIPFVSGTPAIDALGLGGYRGLPFARAAVHGEPAIVELLERLPPGERPTHLALYPNWFGLITSRFGHELATLTLSENVICAGITKSLYRADWSTLAERPLSLPEHVIDELDIADVLDEDSHAYVSPAPLGGWTTHDVRMDETDLPHFDGGRVIPAGKRESFVVKRGCPRPVTLRVRIDDDAQDIFVTTKLGRKPLQLEPPRDGHWRSGILHLAHIDEGDTVTLESAGRGYRDFHVWLTEHATP